MAKGKEYTQRFGTFVLAALFLVTSVGFSLLVIWQVRRENNIEKERAAQLALQEATMLKGTQLDNFTPLTEPVTSLISTDLTPGDGPEVSKGSTITAHYTGALVSNGQIFESSLDNGKPFTAKLEEPSETNGGQGLIKGWVDGLTGMKAGGTRRLVIPYAQAYGEAGSPPNIPAKADLVFDIQVLAVE
jgi:FKBP-type peptidyl-prolyl cis-trans isomerase